MKKELIFVYNADSDLFSTVSDFAHKILSPSTYQCQLCALTHGNFSMKQEWKSFVESLPLETVFLHNDEFQARYKMKVPLPAIYITGEGHLSELVSKTEINSCRSLDALKDIITKKLSEHVEHYHSDI